MKIERVWGMANPRTFQIPPIFNLIKEVMSLLKEWNWLDGHSPDHIIPKNVHFTTGGPWFDLWKPERDIDKTYSKEWEDLKDKVVIEEGLKDV